MNYYGLFNDIDDVIKEYNLNSTQEQKLRKAVIIYAAYEYEDYSGGSTIIYIDEGKIYQVTGSHCSCHGLEDQWIPVEINVAYLLKISRDGQNEFARNDAMKALFEFLDTHQVLQMPQGEIEVYLRLHF